MGSGLKIVPAYFSGAVIASALTQRSFCAPSRREDLPLPKRRSGQADPSCGGLGWTCQTSCIYIKPRGLLLGRATPKGRPRPSRAAGPRTGSDCIRARRGGTCPERTTVCRSLFLIPLEPQEKTGGLWRCAGFGSAAPCAASSKPSSSHFLGCSFCWPTGENSWAPNNQRE